jgi:hypothetical protein
MTLEFTQEEVAALRQLLHRALLHSGMDVLQAVGHFENKLREAEQASPPRANGGAVASASP